MPSQRRGNVAGNANSLAHFPAETPNGARPTIAPIHLSRWWDADEPVPEGVLQHAHEIDRQPGSGWARATSPHDPKTLPRTAHAAARPASEPRTHQFVTFT